MGDALPERLPIRAGSALLENARAEDATPAVGGSMSIFTSVIGRIDRLAICDFVVEKKRRHTLCC
jgi:hypothetical protein